MKLKTTKNWSFSTVASSVMGEGLKKTLKKNPKKWIFFVNLKLILITLLMLGGVIIPVFAVGYDTEIVIDDIWLEPKHPQAGDKVTIKGNVYNAGVLPTEMRASVVTIAFFIDDELRKIAELGNVHPGASNQVTISSGALWNAEWGEHKFEIIIDYHDTLQDNDDNPKNNNIEQVFYIEPVRDSQFFLNVSPSYIIPNKDQIITVNGTLVDKDSGDPLMNQNIVLIIGDAEIPLFTDDKGAFSITKANIFSEDVITITSSFDGLFPHLPTNQSSNVYSLPSYTDGAVLVLKMIDPTGKHNFENMRSEITVFQDSYDTLIAKVSTTNQGILLDDNTAWISLEGDHSYLAEVYLNGRYFFTTDWKQIPNETVLEKILHMPKSAQIRFHITDTENNPILGATVDNWIYSITSGSDGFTEWIEVLPTRSKNEPYVVSVSDSGQIFWSDPFFVTSGEKKIIEIIKKDPEPRIPQWIRNIASWWSNEQISTDDFVGGIQYLINEKIIVVSATEAGDESIERKIPTWLKNTAKWWSEGMISDNEFISALQYLIRAGIIQV